MTERDAHGLSATLAAIGRGGRRLWRIAYDGFREEGASEANARARADLVRIAFQDAVDAILAAEAEDRTAPVTSTATTR